MRLEYLQLHRVVGLLPLLMLLMQSALSFALDEKRLWLPRQYADLKPKLLTVALNAEATERCNRVVDGQFKPNRSTMEYYFFIITCRDIENRSYNMVYHYPVAGGEPQLVTEQRSLSTKNSESEPAADDIEQEEQAVVETDEELWGDWGDWDSIVHDRMIINTELLSEESEDDGDDWGDWGDWETIISEQPETEEAVAESSEEDEWGDWGDWETIIGNKVLDEEGQYIELTEEYAWKLCELELSKRTKLMIDVVVHTEQKTVSADDSNNSYAFEVPIDSKNPMGRPLYYKALCTVLPADGATLKLKARKQR